MLGPPGSNHGLFAALPHAIASVRGRSARVSSRLAGGLSEVFGEPVFILLCGLMVAVAVICGIAAALVTWDAWAFIVVLLVGSVMGVLTFFVVALLADVLERRGQDDRVTVVPAVVIFLAGPAAALVVALVVMAW